MYVCTIGMGEVVVTILFGLNLDFRGGITGERTAFNSSSWNL